MKITLNSNLKVFGLLASLLVLLTACTIPSLSSPEQNSRLTEQAQNLQMLTEQAPALSAQQTAAAQAPSAATTPTATLNVNQAAPQTSAPPTSSSSGNVPPTSTPPTSGAVPTQQQPPQQQAPTQQQAPQAQPAQGPTSLTSSYVELYDWYSSEQGVDLDNSGGQIEMVYFSYKSSDPNPGNAIGQSGGRGTVWAHWNSTPSYEDCRSINSWYPGIFIAKGDILCYITDLGNYGYLRIDRLEQIGTGGGELQPWVLGVSFTTWLP